jgi:hypothetical protein
MRLRLMLAVLIALFTYLLATFQHGDWSVPREWQGGNGPSIEQLQDLPRATQRWITGLHLDARWRDLTTDVQHRWDDAQPMLKDAMSTFRIDK